LPRTSRDQARVGERVRPDWQVVSPGDLVMFQDDDGITHVAIYAGRSRILHSSESGGGVRYDDLSTERGRWFLERLVAARRVTPDLRGLLLDLAREIVANESRDPDRPDHAPRAPTTRRRR
ncbi:MAG: C40 family peptidase, partial [Gemmatimonadaceae bacterium]